MPKNPSPALGIRPLGPRFPSDKFLASLRLYAHGYVQGAAWVVVAVGLQPRGRRRFFLEQTVPLYNLLVDVGRHAVPMFEFFAS